MQTSLGRLRQEASALDVDQRAQLAFDLLQSLNAAEPPAGVEKAWNDEAVRRLQQFDAGKVMTISAGALHANFDVPSL